MYVYMYVSIYLYVCMCAYMYVIFKLDFERYRGNCNSWEGELCTYCCTSCILSGTGGIVIVGRGNCALIVVQVAL